MMPTRISVIIPARNEEGLLARGMESIAAQSYLLESLECVVVDNGSSDGTAVEAARFSRTHAEISVKIVAEPMAGVGRAKNRGAEAARGEVFIFMDADSWMDPDLARDVAAAWSGGHPAGSIRIVADS